MLRDKFVNLIGSSYSNRKEKKIFLLSKIFILFLLRSALPFKDANGRDSIASDFIVIKRDVIVFKAFSVYGT